MLNPLPGIHSCLIDTSRLRTHILQCGDKDGTPLIFIHGNFSAATYFEELMLDIPDKYRCIAVDLRGYGLTEDIAIDATRGARDWSDDLWSLFKTLDISYAHLIGWSAGTAAIIQFMIDHSSVVSSLTLIAPVSPYGFGGSKDLEGTPCYSDFAGSGGGVVNTEFIQRIADLDQTTESELSPLSIIRQLYVNAPFQINREADFLAASFMQKIGDKRYPGDYQKSPNWPYTSPGQWGPINAISAKYLNLSDIVNIEYKPPILWIRGDKDSITGDYSEVDPAVLGEMGLLPDWPGKEIYPPQSSASQMRKLLDQYQKNTGFYQETVMKNTGHSPFLERPNMFLHEFLNFLNKFEILA